MLNPHSVNVLLEAVYEPHYRHFSKYFGNTFAGFFSDEPCLGNETGTYNSKLGKPDLPLPWRDDFPELFSEVIASDIFTLLPGLWFNIGPQTSNIRVAYMNLVTKLYGKCFSQKLGDWCRGHGVEYIGHIVEDMNCHTSTGTSVGHFFRGLSGQDMSGIDVVLHQIVPGHSDISHASPAWGTIGAADPEFFHYSLAKLASSDAHIDSRKKGRALCEIFGAYGWAEGLPMMKWLTDHMLVRGINHFVPHAFSPKYPDMDCPPHFYARGNNPQFLQFRQLMEYTNRICHLFNGGRHISTAAILYHAEAEWSGGKFMLSQKPAKQLADNQIDYDIISSDYLSLARVINGKMQLNDELYSCLIVPFSEILPYDTIKTLGRLASEGLKVFYIDAAPLNTAENKPTDDISGLDKIECVPLNGLVNIINEYNICDIMPDRKCPLLRFYHYQQAETHFYMFFNEDIHNNADVSVNIGQSGPCYFYNAFENRLEKAEYHNGVLKLCLSTYESKIAVFGEINGFDIHSLPAKTVPLKLDLSYKIELKRNAAEEYSVFKSASPLFNITTRHDGVADFSGFIRYTATFSLNDTSYNYLDLGQVYETAKIYLNGTYIGSRICPPYLYEIRDLLKHGENTIEVLVVNNLAHAERDPLSCFLAVPPSGLLGPVVLC